VTIFRCGVAGNPVDHSLSPQIHEAAGRYLGIELVSERVTATDPDDVLSLIGTPFDALSITTPLKSGLATRCRLTPQADVVQSVNSIRWHDGDVEGHCTDGLGLVLALEREFGLDLSSLRVRVLGFGGAARPIVQALGDHKVGSLEVLVRRELDEDEAAQSAPVVVTTSPHGVADVIINATSASLGGATPSFGLGGDVAEGGLVYDLSYGAAHSAWLDLWRASNVTRATGLSMLLWQAHLQLAWWFGRDIPIEVLKDAVA
jgi:shikimate dehydrogenase